MERQKIRIKRKHAYVALVAIAAIAFIVLVTYFSYNKINTAQGAYFSGANYALLNKSINGNFTVSAWVYYTRFNGTGIVLSEGVGENEHSSFYMGSGGEMPTKTVCGVFSNYDVGKGMTAGWRFASTEFVGTGKWVNIACRYNGTSIAIFIDGRFENSTSTPYPVLNAKIIEIGKRTSTFYQDNMPTMNPMTGFVADVQFYNTSLNNSDIKKIFNDGIDGAPISENVIFIPFNKSNMCLSFGSLCSIKMLSINMQ